MRNAEIPESILNLYELCIKAAKEEHYIDSEEFNVNISTLNNEERSMEFKGVLYQRMLAAQRAAGAMCSSIETLVTRPDPTTYRSRS